MTSRVVPDWAEPVWHLFVIRHHARDALQRALSDRGVSTQIHYPIPPHQQAAYGHGHARFPLSEALSKTVLSLPMGPHMSAEQADAVIAALVESLEG